MKFYVYAGHAPLGQEPLGTADRCIWTDLKTPAGARRRASRLFPQGFSLYRFTNFYNNATFVKVGL